MSSQDCSQARCLEIMRGMNNDCFDQKTKQQLHDIKQFLSQTRLFQQLLDEVTFQDILEEAAQKLKYAKYDYGQFLFHYGERGDNIYFILSGSCSVYIPKDEQELARDVRQLEGIEENESSLPSKAKRSKMKKLETKQYGEQESLQNRNDNISILALNEKHLTRYFSSSTKLASYKHVRDLKYLDYFGDLAAGEHFHRRMASIIASSKEEVLEVAFLGLKEYQTIFKSVLERIYKVQTSLLNLFMECPRKLVIDFSFLFNQSMVFDRGQTILTESQALNYIYIIKRGSVSIKKLSQTSNQQLMIALLPPKELLGYENIFNKQEKQIICNFSAVSEQARTELSFALLSDVLMFLRCYPLLEEQLKKKSQQKMQFYLNRIDKTDKITSNPETLQFLKEAKSPKLLQEEDQQAVFSKFLKYSKNNEGDNPSVHSGSSSPKKDKNQEKDQSFTDFSQAEKYRSQLSMQNVQRDNRIIEDSKTPKAKSNLALNRAKSLINLKLLKINETKTPSIEELKEDFSGIQEDYSQSFQPQTAGQLLSDEKLGQSSPQTNLNSFATFSLNCEHSPIQKKNEILSSSKLNPISLINIQLEQNENLLDNSPSAFENEEYSQNESSPKRSSKRQGLIMSKKLKGAIQGMSAVQTQNWTVKEIEKTVQANTEQIKQQDTKEIKLQYLHGEMDSFENAKRFVILKRSTKKQDYLAVTSPKSSSLSTTFKVLKQQYSTEKFSNLLKNDQSDSYSQCSPSDSPVHISQLQANFQRHIASSETSSPIQSPTKKSNTQKYFDSIYSPIKNTQKPQFIFPEVHKAQVFVQNSPTHFPQNTLISQIVPQELPQLSNETTQLQNLSSNSSPLSLILPSTIKNTNNTEADTKSNQDVKMQSIDDSLNKNLLTAKEDGPEQQNKQKIQLKNIPRHHLFQFSNSPIPTQKQRNLNKFKDYSYSPSKQQINTNCSFQNPLKKKAETSIIETITYQKEKSKLKIGGITLYSTIPKEASQVTIDSLPIKQENGWLNNQGKCQQASNVKSSLQTATPTNNLQCCQNSEQQGFQIKRHSSLQKLTSETSPSYEQNIKFVLGKEEQNIPNEHRKNNSFASFSFNYQEGKAIKPQGDKTSSMISSSSLKNKREVKMNIQNENQTENESKSNSTNNKLTDNQSNSTFSKFFCSIPTSSSFSSQFNLSPSKLSYTPQISNVYSNLSKVTSMPSPSELSLSVSPKTQIRKLLPANNQISQNQEFKSFNNGFLEMQQTNIIKPTNMFK